MIEENNKIKVGADREIKFDKSLREKRQCAKETGIVDYNINNYSLLEYEFRTGKKKVYGNVNFNIFIDDYCNADCKFCVAQLRYEHKHAMYKKAHIENIDMYLKRLDEVLKIVRPLNPSVSITGGEPTLSPILTEVMKLVDSYNFRKRTITTNGSGLLRTQDNDTILNNLIKYKWNHLNISRASYDDELNRKIMRYDSEKEYCSMEMLKDVLSVANQSELKHRISCLLLRESVNSVSEIKKYVDFYSQLGANNFIFRELMDYDKSAVNVEKIKYCNENKIRLYDIWNDFDNYPEFIPYLNILGYYYYVEIYKYLGNTVASESADLNMQNREFANNSDVVYEMVFHNNGNLCGSWIDNENVLDPYKNNHGKITWFS